MTKHEWRERNEDGEHVYYRATLHAGRWEFFSTLKSDPDWNQHDVFPLEIMEELRDLLWRKHQRKKLPLKHVEQIDGMIDLLRKEQITEDESPE